MSLYASFRASSLLALHLHTPPVSKATKSPAIAPGFWLAVEVDTESAGGLVFVVVSRNELQRAYGFCDRHHYHLVVAAGDHFAKVAAAVGQHRFYAVPLRQD